MMRPHTLHFLTRSVLTYTITLYNKFLINYFVWETKYNLFSFIDFGTLNTKIATKRLDWLQFLRNIN